MDFQEFWSGVGQCEASSRANPSNEPFESMVNYAWRCIDARNKGQLRLAVQQLITAGHIPTARYFAIAYLNPKKPYTNKL